MLLCPIQWNFPKMFWYTYMPIFHKYFKFRYAIYCGLHILFLFWILTFRSFVVLLQIYHWFWWATKISKHLYDAFCVSFLKLLNLMTFMFILKFQYSTNYVYINVRLSLLWIMLAVIYFCNFVDINPSTGGKQKLPVPCPYDAGKSLKFFSK